MAVTASLKRVQISKANTTMVIAAAASAFVVTFSIVAGRALLNKRAYQSHVIAGKQKAVNQLQANITATTTLVNSYKGFVSTPSNVIGGNPSGKGDRDGDNAKITLDALPSQYDFPALTSSLEKILAQNHFKVEAIAGSDDELNQQNAKASGTPAPVEVPFQISVSTDLAGAKSLFTMLEQSIRPIAVQSATISGNNKQLSVNLTAKTYYQPSKTLSIETQVVK